MTALNLNEPPEIATPGTDSDHRLGEPGHVGHRFPIGDPDAGTNDIELGLRVTMGVLNVNTGCWTAWLPVILAANGGTRSCSRRKTRSTSPSLPPTASSTPATMSPRTRRIPCTSMTTTWQHRPRRRPGRQHRDRRQPAGQVPAHGNCPWQRQRCRGPAFRHRRGHPDHHRPRHRRCPHVQPARPALAPAASYPSNLLFTGTDPGDEDEPQTGLALDHEATPT